MVEISPSQSLETNSGGRRGDANADGGVAGVFNGIYLIRGPKCHDLLPTHIVNIQLDLTSLTY